ncbi:Suppressor of npr1-1 [Thalictrum thalictroides]|uniref:Suppressor of npr1-1 n=1 Tax=Thalictrum thalictroides TaxID=46969 RepID=A0A7J6VQZ1_THATH|nr:Suppressor of npr1-1 [Thalictrum thalictroides]
MVLINELLDQPGEKIEEILSSMEQDQCELKPEQITAYVQEIRQIFHHMRVSLHPVIRRFVDLDLEKLTEMSSVSSKETSSSHKWLQVSAEQDACNEAIENNQLSREQPTIKGRNEEEDNNNTVEEHSIQYLPSQLDHMKTVWEWLNDEGVGIISIQGKSGMGKTLMVRHLTKRADNLFDCVISVSLCNQTFKQVLMQILDQLDGRVTTDCEGSYVGVTKKELKQKVASSLENKSYLLVLDDYDYNRHGEIDVSELGFPAPKEKNKSSKVLLIGPKYSSTCQYTDKVREVAECLSEDEAWLLFQGITGLDINSPSVREVAKPLLGRFNHVPSEIVSQGRNAADLTKKVCDLLDSGRKDVIDFLRFCSFFPPRKRFIKKELIWYWIVEIYRDEFNCLDLDKAYEMGQNILKELIHHKLIFQDNDDQVRSHNLLRHLILEIFTIGSALTLTAPSLYSKAKSSVIIENLVINSGHATDYSSQTEFLLLYGKQGCAPREISDLVFGGMQRLSSLAFLHVDIVSFPEFLLNSNLRMLVVRGCRLLQNASQIRVLRKLQILHLSGASSLKEIPDDIFEHMNSLQDLDLSNNQFKWLPKSFSNLGKLTTLILRGCSQLQSLPSMETCRELSVLDLSGASTLTCIPDISYKHKALDLSATLVDKVPSPSKLKDLLYLFLRNCSEITTMPHPNAFHRLKVLDLSGATSFRIFQGDTFQRDSSLIKLDLSGTLIAELPPFSGSIKLRQLVLRNCCKLEILPPLGSELEVLDLSGCTAFKIFKHESLWCQLRRLDLSKTQIKEVPMSSLQCAMVQLILKECECIEGLPNLELPKLQVLDLSGSTRFKTFKDASLEKLCHLRTLNLSETQVENLPTLSQCSDLRQIILRKCFKLEMLSHLSALNKLEVLDLSGAVAFKQFQDDFFGRKEDFQELNLSETQVVKIPSLSGCSNLRKLILENCSKLEILPKMVCNHLHVLDISGTRISDLSVLSGCVNLCQLVLRDCPNMKTLPPLHDLTRLKVLDLSGTKITEFSFLSGCKSLSQLLLRGCENIQTLKSLKEHTRLEVLDLSGTKLEEFSLLSGCSKLRELSLQGCLKLEMMSFEDMHDLQKVDLSESPMKHLSLSFSGLVNLRTLLLKNCSFLETLPRLELLTKLDVLDLSCTKIRKFPNNISASIHLRFLKVPEGDNLWKFDSTKYKDRFHFCLFALKERIRERDIYLQGQQYAFRDIYYQTSHIPQLTKEPNKFFKVCGFQTFPGGIEEVLFHVELLYLKKNSFLTRLSDLGANNVREMKDCWIENCDSMESVFYGEEVEENAALGKCLQNLWISKLSELKSLIQGIVLPESFTLLKHLYIECCPSLITVFSSHIELICLEVLKIKFCDKIASIFGEAVSGEKTLPNLKTLVLLKLPELQSICGGELLSISNLRIIGCKKLKKLPVSGNRTGPRVKVKGEVLWWKDLEWEDNDTKSQLHFSPF